MYLRMRNLCNDLGGRGFFFLASRCTSTRGSLKGCRRKAFEYQLKENLYSPLRASSLLHQFLFPKPPSPPSLAPAIILCSDFLLKTAKEKKPISIIFSPHNRPFLRRRKA